MSKTSYPIFTKTYVDEDSMGTCEKSECGHIFTKGPALTKDILDKMHHGRLAKKKTWFCGKEFRTSRILLILGLFLIFCFSLAGTYIFWFTDTYDHEVLTKLKILNGTNSYDMWKNPNAQPLINMHIFNYTNVDEYLNGDAEKLHVKDVGPFVYRQRGDKIEVQWNENGTITYQDKRHYNFLPELSYPLHDDLILTVPNLPLIGAAYMSKNSYFFARVALSGIFNNLDATPFKDIPAKGFLWGYEDSLFNLAKTVLSFKVELPYDNFGIFAARNGTSRDLITVDTGETDVDLIGEILKVNGESTVGQWATAKCNTINGTDGSAFSPYRIRRKAEVSFFQKDMCRNFPFVFKDEVTILDGKIPSYRYSPPDNVFSYPNYKKASEETDEVEEPLENHENACYCDAPGHCPPSGVFNATYCALGTPVFISFPHFYLGDESLVDAFEGLSPNKEDHGSFLDVHPTMGFTMGGITRFQVNIQMKRVPSIHQLDGFKDTDLYMPVAWIETNVDASKLKPHLIDLIYKSTFTIKYVGLAFQWGSLLTCLVSFAALLIALNVNCKRKCTRQGKLQIDLHTTPERVTLDNMTSSSSDV